MYTPKSAHFSRVLVAVGIVVCATAAQGAGNWVRIDAGTFQMGANEGPDPIAARDEAP